MFFNRAKKMKKFKIQRKKFEENLLVKHLSSGETSHLQLHNKMLKYLHKNNPKTLNDNVQELNKIDGVDFHFTFYNGDTIKQLQKKMKKIDYDFDHCISTSILSKAQLRRQRKRHLVKNLKKPTKIPKEGPIDMISISLGKLKRMSDLGSNYYDSIDLSMSRLGSRVESHKPDVYITSPKKHRKSVSGYRLPILASNRGKAKLGDHRRAGSEIRLKRFGSGKKLEVLKSRGMVVRRRGISQSSTNLRNIQRGIEGLRVENSWKKKKLLRFL